jgi:hypothetical protein
VRVALVALVGEGRPQISATESLLTSLASLSVIMNQSLPALCCWTGASSSSDVALCCRTEASSSSDVALCCRSGASSSSDVALCCRTGDMRHHTGQLVRRAQVILGVPIVLFTPLLGLTRDQGYETSHGSAGQTSSSHPGGPNRPAVVEVDHRSGESPSHVAPMLRCLSVSHSLLEKVLFKLCMILAIFYNSMAHTCLFLADLHGSRSL